MYLSKIIWKFLSNFIIIIIAGYTRKEEGEKIVGSCLSLRVSDSENMNDFYLRFIRNTFLFVSISAPTPYLLFSLCLLFVFTYGLHYPWRNFTSTRHEPLSPIFLNCCIFSSFPATSFFFPLQIVDKKLCGSNTYGQILGFYLWDHCVRNGTHLYSGSP